MISDEKQRIHVFLFGLPSYNHHVKNAKSQRLEAFLGADGFTQTTKHITFSYMVPNFLPIN